MTSQIRAESIPWDDAEFVREYERAREQSLSEGLTIYGPKAAARVEHLLRSSGYPRAVVEVDRTVERHSRTMLAGSCGATVQHPDRPRA